MTSHEILALNQLLALLLGYTEAELLAMSVVDLRPVEDVEKLKKALTQSPTEGSVEWRYKTKLGETSYVLLTYRNSVFMDKAAGKRRDVRLVAISKHDKVPVRTADDLFGA